MPVYHPEFVHFPIALVALSVIVDIFAYFSGSERLRSAGWWAIFGGALGGIAAVATGLWDMLSIPINEQAHIHVDFHMWVGFAILGAVAVLAIWRGTLYYRKSVLRIPYVVSALFILALITFQNWLGGEIVYAHGVGVAPTGQSRLSVEEAQAPLKSLQKMLGTGLAHEHEHELEHSGAHEGTLIETSGDAHRAQ